MVVKLYISGISGNKEVKKKQQRVQMILDSKSIEYEAIDIAEPGKEKDKEFMQQNGRVREALGKHPLPPQIFNDGSFCGDYEDFDLANEIDELEKFLKIESVSKTTDSSKVNGTREAVEHAGLPEANGADSTESHEPEVNGDHVDDASIDKAGAVTDPAPAAETEVEHVEEAEAAGEEVEGKTGKSVDVEEMEEATEELQEMVKSEDEASVESVELAD